MESFIRPAYKPSAQTFAEADRSIKLVIELYLKRFAAALGIPEFKVEVIDPVGDSFLGEE